MSWLESAIGAISPAWAARRAYWRTVVDGARAYDAAKTGRRTDTWVTSGGSANAEIGAASLRIRARVRDLVRNNPWAGQAVRKLAVKLVGTGIVPRLTDLRRTDRQRESDMALWRAFVDSSDPTGQQDFYGQQHLAARCMVESGECLIRYLPRPASEALPVPLQVQVLEPEYLDSGENRLLEGGGQIIQGVELDRLGRRVAYWLFDEHPGDTISFTRRSGRSRRVEARFVGHLFEALRPGQVRGVSQFAPVVLKLRDIDDIDDAELMRRKVAACFAAVVTRTSDPSKGTLADPGGSRTVKDSSGNKLEAVEPGMFQFLSPGDEVSFPRPPTVEGYLDLMTHQLHAVAAGCGMTYEQLTGDLSRVNYSSIRAGMLDFWELVDNWQWLVVIPQLCTRTWNMVGALGRARGLLATSAPWQCEWAPPRRRWVDPAKEVAALRDAVRSGFTTLDEVIAEQGWDPLERFRQMAEINKRLDEQELSLDSDPRRPVAAPVVAPAGNGDPEK